MEEIGHSQGFKDWTEFEPIEGKKGISRETMPKSMY